VNHPPRDSPTTVEQLLAAARGQLARLSPREADAAMRDGAKLVDIRSDRQRAADGTIPGAYFVPHNVLEWRLDLACAHRDAELARGDAALILICDEGYQSSLAAATVRRFGERPVTDVVGGFRAWRAAGLPSGQSSRAAWRYSTGRRWSEMLSGLVPTGGRR
jgi:rhodanese-related sulfurtransferase